MKKKFKIGHYLPYVLMVALFVGAYLYMESGEASRQFRSVVPAIGIAIVMAVSLNLVVGFLGELSLGHAGFMSIGAYIGCYFSMQMQQDISAVPRIILAMVIGGLAAALFGLIIGIPLLRLRGDYLAIVTLAFGEIVKTVFMNIKAFGGAQGLRKIPKDTTTMIIFIVAMVMLFVIVNLTNSRHGRAIMAIRDNNIAARSVGINITYYKLLVFVISAFFAGVAGVLYGHNYGSVAAQTFDYNYSINILVIVVLGGMGSISGSIISAVVITYLPELLRKLSELEVGGEPLTIFGKSPADYRQLIYAVLLVAIMLLSESQKVAAFRKRISPKRLFGQLMSRIRPGKEEADNGVA